MMGLIATQCCVISGDSPDNDLRGNSIWDQPQKTAMTNQRSHRSVGVPSFEALLSLLLGMVGVLAAEAELMQVVQETSQG